MVIHFYIVRYSCILPLVRGLGYVYGFRFSCVREMVLVRCARWSCNEQNVSFLTQIPNNIKHLMFNLKELIDGNYFPVSSLSRYEPWFTVIFSHNCFCK